MAANAMAPYIARTSAAIDYVEYVQSWSYLRKDFKYMCHVNVE